MKSPLQGRRPVNSTPCQAKAIPGLTDPGISREHWEEWKNSSVATDLINANVQILRGRSVLEALVGARIEQLGAHAQQYITGRVQRLLAPLDSLADWAPMEWGQFKGDRPRQKGGKVLKYEAPMGQPAGY